MFFSAAYMAASQLAFLAARERTRARWSDTKKYWCSRAGNNLADPC
jgi:hypothetical protein